jgi:hypothetical protein
VVVVVDFQAEQLLIAQVALAEVLAAAEVEIAQIME